MIQSRENFFETGAAWKVFNETEKEFVSFLEVVPFVPKHSNVYSFKLFNLMLTIGSHVENVFKTMARYPKFSNDPKIQKIIRSDKPNIRMYGEAFEPIYHLSSKRILIKKEPIYGLREYYKNLIPFSSFSKKSPLWWREYNELKHSWYKENNISKANIINTLNALASLFQLIIRHEQGWNKLIDYHVIRAGKFDVVREYERKEKIKEAFDAYIQGLNKPPDAEWFPFIELWAESRLFIYRYPFWQRWLIKRETIKNMKKWIYRQFYSPLKF